MSGRPLLVLELVLAWVVAHLQKQRSDNAKHGIRGCVAGAPGYNLHLFG
jgi:hypothetical protein